MQNRLHQAARDPKGLEEVTRLIEVDKVDVETIDPETCMTAVYFAAKFGSIETVRYLIEKANANLDASNIAYNVLFYSYFNQSEETKIYLSKPEVYEKFNDGTTLLHAATIAQPLEAFKEVVLKNKHLLTVKNKFGQSPLYYAIKTESFKKVEFLISQIYPNEPMDQIKVGLIMVDELKSTDRRTSGDNMDISHLLTDLGKKYAAKLNTHKAFECFTLAQLVLSNLPQTPAIDDAIKRCSSNIDNILISMSNAQPQPTFFKTEVDVTILKRLDAYQQRARDLLNTHQNAASVNKNTTTRQDIVPK